MAVRMVVLGVFGAMVLASGCSRSAPAPGQVVAITQVCGGSDASRVRLTGYLRYRRELLSFCSNFGGHKTCDLELYESAEAPPQFDILHPRTGPEPVIAALSVPVGSQPGEMTELPDKFKASDIRVNLPNGAAAGEGTRITIDGKLSVVPGDAKTPKSCFVNVEWAVAG